MKVGAGNQKEIVAHLGNLIEYKTEKFKDAIEKWNGHRT